MRRTPLSSRLESAPLRPPEPGALPRKNTRSPPGCLVVSSGSTGGRAASSALAARQLAFRTHIEPQIELLLRVAATLTVSWAMDRNVIDRDATLGEQLLDIAVRQAVP